MSLVSTYSGINDTITALPLKKFHNNLAMTHLWIIINCHKECHFLFYDFLRKYLVINP